MRHNRCFSTSLSMAKITLFTVATAAVVQSGYPGLAQQQASFPLAPDYGQIPLSFEKNVGQTDSRVRFSSRGQGYSLFLTDREAVLALSQMSSLDRQSKPAHAASREQQFQAGDTIRMQLVGARRSRGVEGLEELPGKANYIRGNDPSAWVTDVPTYAKVKFSHAYNGIDLVFYGNQHQLEYDFVVSPHADPNLIRLHFAGAEHIELGSHGDLRVVGHNGEVAFRRPILYQEDHGIRQSVGGVFRLWADKTVAFSVGAYDQTKPLIIDPVLSYSTYLGGSNGDVGFGVAIDGQGNTYVTGTTYSQDFPVSATAYGPSTQGTAAPEAFVTKINPTGTTLVYSTYIGGSGDAYGGDGATAIKVDSKGDAYIAGATFSEDFPVVGGFIQSINNCINAACTNGFVTELNPTGSGLINSTYIGGGAQGGVGDLVNALYLDSSGNVYLTGDTASVDFPVTSGAYQSSNKAAAAGYSTVFIAKLASAFTSLDYSTFLGGTANDSGAAIAVDSAGDAYVAGSTSSANFPVTSGSYQQTNKAAAAKTGTNVFVTELNPTGKALVYSTFLGGTGSTKIEGGDAGNGIAIDASGNATVTGMTASTDFPVTSAAYQDTNKDAANLSPSCFVSRLNSTGTALAYSTFLGGSGASGYVTGDSCSAVALDGSDNAYVVGTTASNNFPTTSGATQAVNNDPDYGNAFLTELNSSGSALIYSSFLGGSNLGSALIPGDSASALTLDTTGNVYITGKTSSSDFPLTKSAYQAVNYGAATGFDTVFVSKIALGSAAPVATTTKLTANANPQAAGQSVIFTAGVTPASGSEYPTGSVDFLVDGTQVSAANLTSGQATYSTSSLTQGMHSIEANFVANANFAASNASLIETITEAVAAAPVFSPAAGSYTTTQSVTLTDSTSGAVLYYTTDGTTPTSASTKYSAAIQVGATTTIKAIAVASGYANSIVSSATYTIQPATATPSFSPAAGSYDTGQNVSITDATTGAAIYYTNDGTTPTASSTRYLSPIVVNYSQTIKALAILARHSNSAVASADYTITAGPTNAPTFSPAAGTYVGPQTITLGETNAYATVYYTTDGTTPTINSNPYFQPILLGGSATVKAIAVGGPITNPIISPVASATYAITASSPYLIDTIAGNGKAGYTGNSGAATNAALNGPTDTAVDASGNIFIADSANDVIRKITAAGIISTYAGNGTAGYGGDGASAIVAELNGPSGVAIDSSGNLYIADTGNNRIRKVTTAGIISTYAGNGTASYAGDGGAATSSTLNGPAGMTFDSSGNLYISEINNNVIRKVTAATVAQPTPIISTFAGNGVSGYSGDGGVATKAQLTNPSAVAVDSNNNVYIADTGNSVIRKVSTAGIISNFAGDGLMDFSGQGVPATSAELYGPQGVVADAAGNVYIADTQNNCIRVVNSAGIITIFAGTGVAGFSGDGGAASTAQMSSPNQVKLDSHGNIYIADYANNRIRKIELPAPTVTATPTFSVAAGTYSTSQSLTLADATPGAVIYFTTDGSTPTTSSTKYTSAINVASTETIKAIAVATGYTNSPVASAAYTISASTGTATPAFSPAPGTYSAAQAVTITDGTAGATIHYTVNGSTPVSSSATYTAPITVSASETINAIAISSGGVKSTVASAAYVISKPVTPVFTPPAGTYSAAQSITITESTPGTTIYYTTNGSTPVSSSTKYTEPIAVSGSITINAIAINSGGVKSPVATAAYVIAKPVAPVFSPVAGTYSGPQSVTITDATAGTTIYYTTNGAVPVSSSTRYTGAIAVVASETIKAIAITASGIKSPVATAAYVIAKPVAPAFSPIAGTYGSPQSVTITETTAGTTIYYTTNGSTPVSSSTRYTGAITVSASETINAIAINSAGAKSPVATAAYVIAKPVAPVFSPIAGTYNARQSVTITEATAGTTIHYTTNGAVPVSSSPIYTAPITVSASETINAIAISSGGVKSTVASAAYVIK
jgi:sugar lactone lactonase YvrE